MKLDINCDLGEGEHPARTRALMRLIDSANVACGGHAGDINSMMRCAQLAKEFDVRLGAHPGIPDHSNFGRKEASPTPAEFSLWVVQQASSLARIAKSYGLSLHHIKLHGALYHASERDETLAWTYIITVRDLFPGVEIYCLSGGRVARLARNAGLIVREELFADRAYKSDGQLVPRHESNAVLSNTREVTNRLRQWLNSGYNLTQSGQEIKIEGQTLCVHGDTENALSLLRAIRKVVAQIQN